MKVWEVQM